MDKISASVKELKEATEKGDYDRIEREINGYVLESVGIRDQINSKMQLGRSFKNSAAIKEVVRN